MNWMWIFVFGGSACGTKNDKMLDFMSIFSNLFNFARFFIHQMTTNMGENRRVFKWKFEQFFSIYSSLHIWFMLIFFSTENCFAFTLQLYDVSHSSPQRKSVAAKKLSTHNFRDLMRNGIFQLSTNEKKQSRRTKIKDYIYRTFVGNIL